MPSEDGGEEQMTQRFKVSPPTPSENAATPCTQEVDAACPGNCSSLQMQQIGPVAEVAECYNHPPVKSPFPSEEVSTPSLHDGRRRSSFVDPRLGAGPKWGHLNDIATIAARPPDEAKACCVEALTNATKRAIGSPRVKEVVLNLIKDLGLGELREFA